ncbi:MAG: hypothetical protein ACM357_09760 [Gemmatimonadota bacterium]
MVRDRARCDIRHDAPRPAPRHWRTLYREADVGIEIILGVLIGVGAAVWFLARRARRRL